MHYYYAGERDFPRLPPEQPQASAFITHRLLSYYYHGLKHGNRLSTTALENIGRGWTMFLDSGAFSAFTQGAKIDVKQYAKFIKEYGHHFSLISALDSLNHVDNMQLLRQLYVELDGHPMWERVCPVHHARDPDEQLQRMLEPMPDLGGYKFPYIFFGGMVPEGTSVLDSMSADTGWLHHIWGDLLTDASGRPLVKTHGFGLTDLELCRKYPWTSVDSSTWVMTSNFGRCLFWRDHVNDIYNDVSTISFQTTAKPAHGGTHISAPLNRRGESRHYLGLDPLDRAQIDSKLANLGVNADMLMQHYMHRDVVNAYFYSRLPEKAATTFTRNGQQGLFA